jgi:cytochrome P450
MIPLLRLSWAVALFSIIYIVLKSVYLRIRHASRARQLGCGSVPAIPSKDPFLGLDIFAEDVGAFKSNTLFEHLHRRHQKYGDTFTLADVGVSFIVTIEPKNVQAILATQFKEFSLPTDRHKAFFPLLGTGIFTSNGFAWEHSRALLRPNFVRQQVADLDTFETHVSRFLELIPADGKTMVDWQDLFFRLTLDSATEFLFGESANSLLATAGEENDFAEAFNYAMTGLVDRYIMRELMFLHRDKKFYKSCEIVHSFIDKYVNEAIEQARLDKADKTEYNKERYVFLKELAKQSSDPLELRFQLANILLAGRDTTACLLSNMFYVLSRRPDIWKKLKAEVATLGGKAPTFEGLKDLKYLQYCINECKCPQFFLLF